MENGPFIDDDGHIKSPIYRGFSMAMLNSQIVICNDCNAIGSALASDPSV